MGFGFFDVIGRSVDVLLRRNSAEVKQNPWILKWLFAVEVGKKRARELRESEAYSLNFD